jgi:signal peptidase I
MLVWLEKINGRKIWNDNRGLVLFLALMFVFRSSLADWNVVPTGSMQPTIVEGDRILVNKMAYDLRLPFTHIPIIQLNHPERGDIIIFDSKVSKKRLVKRVIGVPGDVVMMRDNVLSINGQILQYEEQESSEQNDNDLSMDLNEDLVGVKHMVRVLANGSRSSSFGPIEIPREQYLALGDNRDNSADSRVIGFIPRNEIVGRTRSVVMSLNYDEFYLPRKERFFKTL